jgi:hypothetical protein
MYIYFMLSDFYFNFNFILLGYFVNIFILFVLFKNIYIVFLIIFYKLT